MNQNQQPSRQHGDQKPAPYISQRGYRTLVAMTAINSALILLFLVAPFLGHIAAWAWQHLEDQTASSAADEQRQRLQRQKQQERQQALAPALTYNFAPGQLIYEEEPRAAADLLKQRQSFRPTYTSGSGDPPAGWQSPARAIDPKLYRDLADKVGWGDGVLFLHERKSPVGKPMLVVVHLYANQGFSSSFQGDQQVYRQTKTRVLKAWAYELEGDKPPARPLWEYILELLLPDSADHEIARRPTTQPANSPVIAFGHHLRLFAGQVDPADDSHFTIAYQVDDKPGTIDGRLRANGVELRPREGSAVDGASPPKWKLPSL